MSRWLPNERTIWLSRIHQDAGSAHGYRHATKLRIVSLFDGYVEGAHVDVDDLPLAIFVHRASLSLRPARGKP
jgi:hypothetical protein